MLNGKRVTVVLPAYNAAQTIEQTVAEIPRDVVADIVVVDDRSSDNTVEIAEKLDVQVEVHEENLGYGGNQKTCYRLALERDADVLNERHQVLEIPPGKGGRRDALPEEQPTQQLTAPVQRDQDLGAQRVEPLPQHALLGIALDRIEHAAGDVDVVNVGATLVVVLIRRTTRRAHDVCPEAISAGVEMLLNQLPRTLGERPHPAEVSVSPPLSQ